MTVDPSRKGPTDMFFDLLGSVSNVGGQILMREQDRKDYKAGLEQDRRVQASTGLTLGQHVPLLIGGGIAIVLLLVLALVLKR